MAKKVTINEFRLEDMPLSCTWMCVGPPSSGKSSMIESFAYYLKHRYPTAWVSSGTETAYDRFCKVFGSLYVRNYYSEDEFIKFSRRQRQCALENGIGNQANYCLAIVDDPEDMKIFKSSIVCASFKLGSQHWHALQIWGLQYGIDPGPSIRKSVSYVAIFREPEEKERKKLYENFGGITGSFEVFNDLMDQLTGDYTCLVIKKRSQSNNLEDCVFYFKGVDPNKLGNWKFGCKEAKQWCENRYNKNYVEDVPM